MTELRQDVVDAMVRFIIDNVGALLATTPKDAVARVRIEFPDATHLEWDTAFPKAFEAAREKYLGELLAIIPPDGRA
jgi:hypothetical protein